MQEWISEAVRIVHRALGSPELYQEEAIVRIVGILALLITYRAAIGIAGVQAIGGLRPLAALAAGLLVMLASAAATSLYLLPVLSKSVPGSILALLMPIVLTLAIGVPVQCALLRSKYVPTLIAMGACVTVTGLILTGTNAVLGSVYAGKEESDIIRAHKERTEAFINRREIPADHRRVQTPEDM